MTVGDGESVVFGGPATDTITAGNGRHIVCGDTCQLVMNSTTGAPATLLAISPTTGGAQNVKPGVNLWLCVSASASCPLSFEISPRVWMFLVTLRAPLVLCRSKFLPVFGCFWSLCGRLLSSVVRKFSPCSDVFGPSSPCARDELHHGAPATWLAISPTTGGALSVRSRFPPCFVSLRAPFVLIHMVPLRRCAECRALWPFQSVLSLRRLLCVFALQFPHIHG